MRAFFTAIDFFQGRRRLTESFDENPAFRLFAMAWGARRMRKSLASIAVVSVAVFAAVALLLPYGIHLNGIKITLTLLIPGWILMIFFGCFFSAYSALQRWRVKRVFEALFLTPLSSRMIFDGFVYAQNAMTFCFMCMKIVVLAAVLPLTFLALGQPQTSLTLLLTLFLLMPVTRLVGEVAVMMGCESALRTRHFFGAFGLAAYGLVKLVFMAAFMLGGIMAPSIYLEEKRQVLGERLQELILGEDEIGSQEAAFEFTAR